MAKVYICKVDVLNNPAPFLSKFDFEITFESTEDLNEDLEWKIIYVGSADSEEYDQILDTIYVGPVPGGCHKFTFTSDPPNPYKIPEQDVCGCTVILITCEYRNQVFVQVGFYVNNTYDDQELQENPPDKPDFGKLTREILTSQPRITHYKINWSKPDLETATGEGKAPVEEIFTTDQNDKNNSSL